MKNLFTALAVFMATQATALTYTDTPYIQDYADKFAMDGSFGNTALLGIASDRNKTITVLSSDGLLQPWEKRLVADLRYRPLTDLNIVAVARYENQLVYLTDKAVLSNAWAGKFYIEHGLKNPSKFVMAHDFTTLVSANGELALFQGGKKTWDRSFGDFLPKELVFDKTGNRFLILTKNTLYQLTCPRKELSIIYEGENLTAIALMKGEIILGTGAGVLTLDGKTFKPDRIDGKLPWTEITAVEYIHGRLWFGSTEGAFKLRDDGKYDYYASKRWLVDDEVLDIAEGPDNSVLVLSKKGLSKINFVETTLADKAEYFQEIQRLRHIRYGFSARLILNEAGDLSSGVYSDTDNDGLWTSMYLAGELFRYAVTKSEDAKQNAYEAFEAMERLTEISGIPGFPARTYEIDSYQSSDVDHDLPEEKKIWRLAEDERWRWKSSTSSDESCGHFFAYALFAELAPDELWRERAIHQIKIEMDHIIRNDWYLVTWNGKPTRWGRWNPEYVNGLSIHTGDRRLNSSLVLAFLQTTYRLTGEETYKEKALELMDEFGYGENAMLPSHIIGRVENENLSDTWNHSDDEMYFLTIPALVNYAFTDDLKLKFFEAARSHWKIERSEKNPLWNYLYALAGGTDYDSEDSAWWLREFPLDLIAWTVDNHHRKDIERIAPNFRKQEYAEVLPRDERPMHLHNNAYRNSGNEGGRREYPPYLYLLPYWAGRYVDAISAPDEPQR